MERIAFFIENIAPGLYIFGVLVIIVNLRALMMARYELGNAEFALERELAQRRQAGAITRALFAVEAMLAVYAFANVITPTLRNDQIGITSGPGGVPVVEFKTLAPGQATLVNAQGTPIDANQIEAPFQTLTAMPREGGPEIIPTLPTATQLPGTIIPGVAAPVGCERPKDKPLEAVLEVPANGQVLFESVTVRGVANTANFARYKFEISGPSTGGNFAPFGGDKTSPVKDWGTLGQLSLISFTPGEYQFKLAVFDATDQLRASCTVTVFLRGHAPTPTPITPTPTPVKQ